AFSTLKRSGLIGGGKKGWHYVKLTSKLLFKIGRGDVLIITGGIGDSAHYRAFNQAEELNAHGIKTAITLQENPRLLKLIDTFQVFIFRRTIETDKLKKVLQKIKTQNKTVVFETDDLVFDPHFIQNTDLYKNKMTALEKLEYKKGLGIEILTDPYTKTCVTSTSYLAKILEGYGKKVFISKNKICNKEVEIAQKLVKDNPKTALDEVRVGYYSGTSSHDLDFAEIAEAMLNILEKYPQVRLVLGGPLKIDARFEKYTAQTLRLPLALREKYYDNLYLADINLAPLVLSDPFCEAKSEIKFLEAGILGIPTVAIKNQTFSESIVDGTDGFLAGNKEEWQRKLEQLIESPELRQKIGLQAQAKIIKDSTTKNSHNEEYYDYLRKICHSRVGGNDTVYGIFL
ncbi:MAG: glycosyltransferase, partial [Candidatus Moraniibacteriota bacterium]